MDTKDVKNIKIIGTDTQKVMANNEVWWKKIELLKPDYEFYDSEIGKNSNWSKNNLGYWYLSKFKGQTIAYLRNHKVNMHNKIGKDLHGQAIWMPSTGFVGDYGCYFYSDIFGVAKSEAILFKNSYNDNTYKNYVFICPEKYNEEFAQKLEDFANSL